MASKDTQRKLISDNKQRPRDVVAVLEELGKRRGLTVALANRDEELLEPILSFLICLAFPV